jgi:hypothetical protein
MEVFLNLFLDSLFSDPAGIESKQALKMQERKLKPLQCHLVHRGRTPGRARHHGEALPPDHVSCGIGLPHMFSWKP